MTTVLATYNIKGGVGKTTTAVNLAYLAARDGYRTLVWDLDPQGGATFLFRVRPEVEGGGRELVRMRTEAATQIRATDHEGLDLLPADFSYRHLDLALDSCKHPTRRLGMVLKPLRQEYDCIFLDCPPSISLVSESVFEAADALLVPVIPATLSSRTYERLETLADGGPAIFAFLSMADIRRERHRHAMSRLRALHHLTMLGAVIPNAEEIERMGEERNPLFLFAPQSRAALAYQALWLDLRRRLRAAASRGG
jgi:cellulose biosynthesis protein BcsQ